MRNELSAVSPRESHNNDSQQGLATIRNDSQRAFSRLDLECTIPVKLCKAKAIRWPSEEVLTFVISQLFLLQAIGEFPSPPDSSMAGSSSDVASPGSVASSEEQARNTASSVLRALSSGSAASPSTGVSKEIDELMEAQRQARAQRAQIAKDLKNAQRRRQRLKHKARLLTAADLASVLVLRQEEEEAAQTRTKRRRSSQPGRGSAGALSPAGDAREGSEIEREFGGDDEEAAAESDRTLTERAEEAERSAA